MWTISHNLIVVCGSVSLSHAGVHGLSRKVVGAAKCSNPTHGSTKAHIGETCQYGL